MSKRSLFSVFGLMVIISGALVQAQEYRPETGTFLKDTVRSGYGELEIINDNPQKDAVAILNTTDRGPIFAVYIRSKELFTISGIEDGSYDMYFEIGNNWNNTSDKFEEKGGFYRLDRSLPFETIKRSDGIEYSVWTVALEAAAPNANVAGQKVTVNEEDFPNLK